MGRRGNRMTAGLWGGVFYVFTLMCCIRPDTNTQVLVLIEQFMSEPNRHSFRSVHPDGNWAYVVCFTRTRDLNLALPTSLAGGPMANIEHLCRPPSGGPMAILEHLCRSP